MSGQRGRSPVEPAHRSAHPNVTGVPWWGAVVIAVTAAAIGFAFDAGSETKELTAVFATLYAIGCVAAVLAVRQAALFTAVVQPPLLLFVLVPGAYFLFTGSEIAGVKDLAINCGYPLIERFPLMLAVSATVLVIGAVRWFLGSRRSVAPSAAPAHKTSRRSSRARRTSAGGFAGLKAKLTAGRDDDEPAVEEPRRRRPAGERPSPSTRTPRPPRRPRETDDDRRAQPRPRRRPPATEDPDIGDYLRDLPERPRRSRPSPRENGARDRYPPGRLDPYERPERSERPERRPRPEPFDFDAYEPEYRRRERTGRNGTNGVNGSHHPVSRVRYRSAEDGESRSAYRHRPRHSRGDWDG
ncbi:hypothetical protein LV457_00850 [Mycobacterium sp. MYCO198283]|nr:hypothetical protein [Mycobacterium sp. MYCO198283]